MDWFKKGILIVAFIMLCMGCGSTQQEADNFVLRAFPNAEIIQRQFDPMGKGYYSLCRDGAIIHVIISTLMGYGIIDATPLNPHITHCEMRQTE